MNSTIHSSRSASRPERPRKTLGQKLMEFFSSPVLVLMTCGGIALVLVVPYLALRTLPNFHNPFTLDEAAPRGDPYAGINLGDLQGLPSDLTDSARSIVGQDQPTLPDSLTDLDPASGSGLIYPVTEAVESGQPTLSWSLFAPGPYEAALTDEMNQVVASARNLPTLSWVVSAHLKRGARYNWRVTAANREVESASFVVLTDEQAGEWKQVRAEHSDSHLVLGVAAEALGLLSIAEREYQELARQFPNAEGPARLLANVQALRE